PEPTARGASHSGGGGPVTRTGLSPANGANPKKPLELRRIRGVRPLLSRVAQGVVSMFSKPLALVLLALGCLTAAAGGAYVANRHNVSDAEVLTTARPTAAPA